MRRLGDDASSIRTMSWVRMVSQIRGGAKKYVGPISFRSCMTVATLSGQLVVKPVAMDCPNENM
jgi:hypothetical protein